MAKDAKALAKASAKKKVNAKKIAAAQSASDFVGGKPPAFKCGGRVKGKGRK